MSVILITCTITFIFIMLVLLVPVFIRIWNPEMWFLLWKRNWAACKRTCDQLEINFIFSFLKFYFVKGYLQIIWMTKTLPNNWKKNNSVAEGHLTVQIMTSPSLCNRMKQRMKWCIWGTFICVLQPPNETQAELADHKTIRYFLIKQIKSCLGQFVEDKLRTDNRLSKWKNCLDQKITNIYIYSPSEQMTHTLRCMQWGNWTQILSHIQWYISFLVKFLKTCFMH